MIKVRIITETSEGELQHTRSIQMESREALEKDIKKWQALGLDNYEPELAEDPTGETILTWREKAQA